MIKTKSVHTSMERPRDGFRILATRVRGRGMKKTRYDAWMPNLAPSEKLLGEWRADSITWAKFSRLYRAEILQNPPLDKGNINIKNHGQKFTLRLIKKLSSRGPVTVMCHCDEDEQWCHRHLLKKLIERA